MANFIPPQEVCELLTSECSNALSEMKTSGRSREAKDLHNSSMVAADIEVFIQ